VPDIEIDWDEDSIEHIARHNVEPEEVEEVLMERYLLERGRRQRSYVLGRTGDGRYLFIVPARRRSQRYRVITAREMTTTERRRFQRKVK